MGRSGVVAGVRVDLPQTLFFRHYHPRVVSGALESAGGALPT